jgi:hypothetical protein
METQAAQIDNVKANNITKEGSDNSITVRADFLSFRRPAHSVTAIDKIIHTSSLRDLIKNKRISVADIAKIQKSMFSLRPARDSVTVSNAGFNKKVTAAATENVKSEPLTVQRRPVSIISLTQKRIALSKEQVAVERVETKTPSLDFLDYLKLSQRHDSINFIYNVDSAEMSKSPRVKFVGPFLLGDKIGKGSFGKVKEGICSETLERVAVKVIGKLRAKKTQQGVEGVVREILLLKKLSHPNIISLLKIYAKVEDSESESCCVPWFQAIEEEPVIWQYDDGTEHEKPVQLLKWYLVFQFCPCTLQHILENSDEKRLPLEESQRYFSQLMQGVDYLHSLGIIRIIIVNLRSRHKTGKFASEH